MARQCQMSSSIDGCLHQLHVSCPTRGTLNGDGGARSNAHVDPGSEIQHVHKVVAVLIVSTAQDKCIGATAVDSGLVNQQLKCALVGGLSHYFIIRSGQF